MSAQVSPTPLVDPSCVSTGESSIMISEEIQSEVKEGLGEEDKNDEGASLALPQVVINKMPKHCKKKDFEKFLAGKGVKYRKCKVVPNKSFAFLTFDNSTDCETATTTLQGTEYRKSSLEIVTRTHNNHSDRKRENNNQSDDRLNKRPKREENDEDTVIKTARDAVSPWWNVPYEEQLTRKTKAMAKDCLNKCFREIRDAYAKWNKAAKWDNRKPATIPNWILEAKSDELSWVDYLPIIASPEPVGYRNKCEFTFGVDSTDTLPAVGFRVSTFNQGVLVGNAQDCPNVSKPMKILVNTVNSFLRGMSALKVYDMKSHTGVWRLLTVRYSKRTQQMIVMLCVSLKSIESAVWSQELSRLTELLKELYRTPDIDHEDGNYSYSFDQNSNTPEKVPMVTSFCYQVYDGLSVPSTDHEVISVFGETTIMENMNNCSFRVSPQAFFQVNTPCAELLYGHVMGFMQDNESSSPSDNTNALCLDVCSGTGTIGICCAKAGMGHMIGVELCQAAVDDAVDNATLNGLTLFTSESNTSNEANNDASIDSSRVNKYECGFICSRAETVLESLIGHKKPKDSGINLKPFLDMAQGKKVLAVVDPPREGLHVDCLRAIRNCSRIERLVYVSCNPTKSLPRDVATLCGPSNKKLFGQAFRPSKATPVDLFPHTPHCEMILVLERCCDEK